jgi:PQQ-dependent catabolism-associated CXXCW motif protein
MENYKAPTPATLSGATVVSTPEAQALWHNKAAVFIDVLPHPPKPADLPARTVWHDPPHRSVPGAVWLRDVGFGALAPAMEDYFRRGLAEVTGDDHAKPLLFFCKRDCWMSWNAAKRALAAGYSKVYWYPDGVEGWSEAGLALEEVRPQP